MAKTNRKTSTEKAPAAAEKKAAKATKGKSPRTIEVDSPIQPRKLGALDAAAKVLAETKKPMNCKDLIEAMATKGYWTSPGGKTPHATLFAAMTKEIATKGNEARFKKVDRGQFAIQ